MTMTSNRDKLFDLIKDTRFGMLTHRHGDGQLHSHPLTTQNKKGDEASTLYFFVPRDGDIAKHVASDSSVNVAYANTDVDSYVSVTGEASLLEDTAKKNELFNPAVKAWFPAGVTDPNLGLLAVKILDAEYWDVTDSKMVQLFKIAKAAVTGAPLKDLGEHKKLA